MDEAVKQAILRTLSKEDILELFDIPPEEELTERTIETPTNANALKLYAKQKIPGTTKKCSFCSRDLVDNENHAIELLGGEKE